MVGNTNCTIRVGLIAVSMGCKLLRLVEKARNFVKNVKPVNEPIGMCGVNAILDEISYKFQ